MSSPSLRILACAAVALAVCPLVASAQRDSARVDRPADTRERWLERPTVPGLARLDHTLASGDYVQLSDGTIWSIYLADRPTAVNWRAGDLIVVRQSGVAYGEYDHILTNNSDGSRVFARLGGPPPGIERPH